MSPYIVPGLRMRHEIVRVSHLTMQHIDNTVLDYLNEAYSHFNHTRELLFDTHRKGEKVYARQLCMYLCATNLTSSLKSIGEYYGNKDHTTVIHSREKIRGMMRFDELVLRDVNEIIRRL